MDGLDFLAVQGTLKSLLQNHSSKVSILRGSAFFLVQLLQPYMTAGKTVAAHIPGSLGLAAGMGKILGSTDSSDVTRLFLSPSSLPPSLADFGLHHP